MFDKTHLHVRQVRESVTENVNVTVHNAPTIESAKLLKELEETALSKIVGDLRTVGNSFNIAGVFKKNDFNGPRFVGKFLLNGDEYRIDIKLMPQFNHDLFIRDLFSEVSAQITAKLLTKALPDLVMNFDKAARI